MTSASSSQILVVDDHDLNLKLLQRVLELDGYNVTAVSMLSAADRAIARELPALVVLDLNLPDGDGLDLARKLKRDWQTARCSILACTAGAMSGDRDRALGAGCDAYMSKPIVLDARSLAAVAARGRVRLSY